MIVRAKKLCPRTDLRKPAHYMKKHKNKPEEVQHT